ncbi:tyrosine-type recombinase/integrase [Bacillus mobilis]|uniref:tyrosine-type recombinase/integrase n=1 Tax=Bacillus mobilis TaxID=2026190 RepID=UPI0022E4705B|nr:tyrosine-type recombinase/integrase [Bacillus mobilis]
MNKRIDTSLLESIPYSKNIKEQLKQKTIIYGDFSFDDDTWSCLKKRRDTRHLSEYTLHFKSIPQKYRELVKYFALSLSDSIGHIRTLCGKLIKFLNFLEQNFPKVDLKNVNRSIINKYEYWIHMNILSDNVKRSSYLAIRKFFSILNEFPELPDINPTKQRNPFPEKKGKPKERYIPQEVIGKWDSVMKTNTDIPLEFRTLYWLLRSFPNRITEILSMKRECIKSFYSEYTILIPTFKQTGGYNRPEIKAIPVIYTGHGKYVIDLIRELQIQTEALLSNTKYQFKNKGYTDLLFIVKHWTFSFENKNINIRINNFKKLTFWTHSKVNSLLEQLAIALDIRDKNNKLFIPTTHQFRHNAVTDRLYVVGYTTEQVRKLTGHKNEKMTKYYVHQLVEKHKEIHLNIENLKNEKESPVSFRGKIINLDERTQAQLEKDSRKYLTWEANGKKGVGICSDISGCNPKGTSIHFECYACDWFVPKIEYLDDYQKEYSYWKQMIEQIGNNKRRAAHLENAIRNVSYLERIINICEIGIEKFEKEAINEQINNKKERYRWE